MSGGQIDQVDVNSYQNFILNLELDGVFVIDIGKTRRKEHLFFFIFIYFKYFCIHLVWAMS